MSQSSRWIYAVTFLLASAGFLTPYWPLSVVGVIIAGLSGRWIFSLLLGLLLDIAWGAPTGTFKYLFFPFTIVALLCVIGRYWGTYYFLDKNPQERL